MKTVASQEDYSRLFQGFYLLRSLTPLQQVYVVVAVGLVLQYSINTLTYYQLLPDIFGKSLNGIAKNTSYVIPGVVAVTAALLYSGRNGLLRLLKPYAVIPLNFFWWLFPVGMLIAILWLSLVLNDLLYQREFAFYAINFPSWEKIKLYSPLIIMVAICDELFWIGIILPRLLLAGLSPLKASLVMGVFWGLEYLPFIFTEFFVAPGLSAYNLVLGWFALTPLYVWLYQKTGSALVIVFFNLCMQFSYSALPVLPLVSGDNSVVAMVNFATLLVGAILWWAFPDSKRDR